MRAIDADELWEKMYRYSDNEGAKMPYGDDDSLICKDSACFLIENAPTIEPERKKGKWIVVDDAYNRISGKCSACGWEAHMYEDDVVGMDYCPNCGADMRGGQDETD